MVCLPYQQAEPSGHFQKWYMHYSSSQVTYILICAAFMEQEVNRSYPALTTFFQCLETASRTGEACEDSVRTGRTRAWVPGASGAMSCQKCGAQVSGTGPKMGEKPRKEVERKQYWEQKSTPGISVLPETASRVFSHIPIVKTASPPCI